MRKLFFFLLFVLSLRSFAQTLDIDMLSDINATSAPILDKSFKAITNTATPIAIALPVGMLITGLITKDKKAAANSLQLGASFIVGAGISAGLKYIINRPRPYVTYSSIEQKTPASGPSFPSGQTTLAFAEATSFSLCYPKWYVIVPSYLWAGSVAYSRMYLGVHYPSDILGGMIIGSGSAILVYKVQQWIYRRNHDYSNRMVNLKRTFKFHKPIPKRKRQYTG
jgi:membrane-associated phospholipid phosphatase